MKRHSFYIDSHRHLVGEAVLGVQGEHLSDVICVVCPRYWGERDLSQSVFTLAFRVGDYFEEISPESVSVESDIVLCFPVTRTLTAKDGKVTIGIIARCGDECVFKSENAECVVKGAVFSSDEISEKFPNELTQIQNSLDEKATKTDVLNAVKAANCALSLLEENKADKSLVREDILALGEELEGAISEVDTRKMEKLSTHSGNIAGLSNGAVCDSNFSLNKLDGDFFELTFNGENIFTFEKKPFDKQKPNDIQAIVRSGLANRYFKVGDTISTKKGDEIIEWTVIGIDEDTPSDDRYTHSLTLMLKDAYTSFQFDTIQALYYCNEYFEAGNFHLIIDGQTYAFTSSVALKPGMQLCVYSARTFVEIFEDAYAQSYIEKPVLKKVDEVPENSTELAHLNELVYATGGSNEYLSSPIRLWLNSEEADWWEPSSRFSRRHYKAGFINGFLCDIDREFLNVLGKVKKNTFNDFETITSNEKVFLLSAKESGVAIINNEGKPYSYFDSDEKRIKTLNGSPTRWWLRTAKEDEQNKVWTVDVTGTLNHNICSSAAGVCPVCCIV